MNALDVDTAMVTNWRMQRFTWTAIAGFLHTDTQRLGRWRARTFFVDPFDDVSDEELDNYITEYTAESGEKGENSIDSYLFGVLQVKLSRERLRAAIKRVCGDALEERRNQFGKKIVRKGYEVKAPHSLWHVDGMHKLIRYGLIVHGCVDGFSRLVIWMQISTNNRAKTQLSYLKAAIKELHITPSRMRGDLGGENTLMADEITVLRGLNRGSFIFGTSRNNIRIERHWRDLRRSFTQFWMTLLKQMERDRVLDVDDDKDLFLVQFLYAPRMQKELDLHRTAYNNHKLSTEGNYVRFFPIKRFLLIFSA